MNKFNIKWSFYAKNSLDSIIDYIKQESPSNSRKVKKTLISIIGTLNQYPNKYPIDPYISRNKGTFRFISKWNYKIVYEITKEEIIIIDIFHTSQLPEKIQNSFK
ncbi:MAG: type II toxin-antitoxin system RelE/ParE family toxin [Bacteroidota bacterium]